MLLLESCNEQYLFSRYAAYEEIFILKLHSDANQNIRKRKKDVQRDQPTDRIHFMARTHLI